MSYLPIVIAAVALACASIGLTKARRTEAANAAATAGRHRIENRQQRIRENPADHIGELGARHNMSMEGLRSHLGDANAKLAEAIGRLQNHPVTAWTSDAYRLRVLVLVGFVVMWLIGLVLNVGIFVALLGFTPFAVIVAVAFGVLASVIELMLAGVLGLQLGQACWPASSMCVIRPRRRCGGR